MWIVLIAIVFFLTDHTASKSDVYGAIMVRDGRSTGTGQNDRQWLSRPPRGR